MFKNPNALNSEPKSKVLIPSECSAFSTPKSCPPIEPVRKKARYDDKNTSSEPTSVVTPEVDTPGCICM